MKFRGLVNVSGFHVDPGYSGRLIFSVFNAGPAPVHLQRGEPYFLIWYADLDHTSARIKSKADGFNGIPAELINPIAGEIHSFTGLLTKIKASEEKLEQKMQKIEKDHQVLKAIGTVLITLAVGLALRAFVPASDSTPTGRPTPLEQKRAVAPTAQPKTQPTSEPAKQ